MNPVTPILERLVGFIPKPVLLGIGALVAITFLFWVFETRPKALSYGFLLDPLYYTLVAAVILIVVLYYVVSIARARPRATKPGRVGVWLARIEGDDGGEYLRDLRGQAEQELASDPSLRNVDVSVLPREMKDHDEAREEGSRLNAGAVVWGNLGKGLDERRVGNLKLTIVGGPMKLRSDVQVGRDVDLAGYEMRDVARFVAGYALLSRGRPVEALVHFDRILEDARPGLFDVSDALQFGGIACSLATRESSDSDELLDKATRYFTRYRDMWPEESAPKPRAMGFFNLAGVQRRGPDVEGIKEALRLYNEASRLFDKASDDEGYAMAQIEVAGILSDLYESQNLAAFGTRALIILDGAKDLLDKENHPHRYARMQFERGRLLVRMARAVPSYYQDAIAAFDEALQLYVDVGFPFEAAMTLLHRGGARMTAEGADDQVRHEVLDDYDRALSVATKERFPGTYAEIQTSRCAVLLDLPPTADNLRAAVEAGREALSLQTPEEHDVEYARAGTCHAMACLAYASLQGVTDEEATRHLEDALRSAEAAQEAVGPTFYPNRHRSCIRLAEDARTALAGRGANI